ncbi:MAG: peroxiredoxin family protein [Phycisphaerales bacterium JB043]
MAPDTRLSLPENRAQRAESVRDHRPNRVIPHFTLTDSQGNTHTLSDYRGAPVVLDWTHYECGLCHRVEELVVAVGATRELARRFDARWLAINSDWGAPRNLDRIERFRARYAHSHPYLLDPGGLVAKSLGVYVTPQVVVIDASGRVAYSGSPRTSNMQQCSLNRPGPIYSCLEDLQEGRPVRTPSTPAFGRYIQTDPPAATT